MLRGICIVGLVGLIGTSAIADNKYFRAQAPLPPEVEANLPADVGLRDVLVQDGCFFYLYEGKVYPVTTADNPSGPYCVG